MVICNRANCDINIKKYYLYRYKMERKHFVTTAQTVLTRIISISVNKSKKQKYDYLIAKLPATFKDQTVTFWSDKKGYGGRAVAKGLGGSGMIRFSPDFLEEKKFELGDVLTVTFKDKDAELD